MWVDPDPAVAVMRDMLQACAAWQQAGGALGQVHYPGIDDLDVAVAPLPRAWISLRPTYQRAFTGVALPGGSIDLGLQAWGRLKLTLLDVDDQRIEVAGDHTAVIVAGSEVRIAGTDTALDAWYRVDAVGYNAVSGRTEIDTVGQVPAESIAGGAVYCGEVERLAAAIARQLQQQQTGLYLSDADPDLATEPEEGSTADYVTISIRLTTGLELST